MTALSRRSVLAGSGALVVSFSLRAEAQPTSNAPGQPPPAALPGSLKEAPWLDAWIRIGRDGTITVFTGKAELGQGIGTALLHAGHSTLDDEGVAAYLEASSPRSRLLYLAHGYTDHGPPIQLPGGPPMHPMWRPSYIRTDRSDSVQDRPDGSGG